MTNQTTDDLNNCQQLIMQDLLELGCPPAAAAKDCKVLYRAAEHELQREQSAGQAHQPQPQPAPVARPSPAADNQKKH